MNLNRMGGRRKFGVSWLFWERGRNVGLVGKGFCLSWIWW